MVVWSVVFLAVGKQVSIFKMFRKIAALVALVLMHFALVTVAPL